MSTRLEETGNSVNDGELVYLELERCRRELDECHRRMGELEQGEALLAGENRLLEMVAKGESLPSILDGICRLVEEISSGSLCSILLLDASGNRLWHGAAPSLPASYIGAFGGRAIGPTTGPCGRACFFKKPVIVCDIAADSLGDDYRDLALAHGLKACWSTPIFSSEGKVLGSFAVLSREPRSPTPEHQRIIAQITHLASVAIERKRTEAALRESEERFRRMADAIPEVIWFTALEPEKVLYVSPSFERIWGLPVGKLYENPRLWIEAIHPDDRERVTGIFSRWVAGEEVNYHNIEYRIVRPGGAIRWIHERGVLSVNEKGQPYLASGISTDITERKRAEEGMRRGDAYLAEAQKLSRTGSFGWNVSTGEIIWSKETYCILGYDQVMKPNLDLVFKRVHPEDRTLVQQTIDCATRDGTDLDFGHRLLVPDGVVKHVHVVARATKAESGAIEFVGAVMDVTEQKRAEAFVSGEKRLLEMIARGSGFASVLDELCRFGEEMSDNALVSILLVSPDRKSLRHGAAPSLPKSYTDAIDGGLIGPRAGSCGTAAYRGERVIVSDITTDPLWDEYRHLAMEHGFRACWSTPIFSTTRHVMGTFALYSREPGGPSSEQLNLIEQITHLAAVAIEREQAAEALHASEHLARGQVEALKSALDAVATESAPDRLVEHVLRTLTEQFGAHSSSVWRRDETKGMIGFEFAFEDGRIVTKADSRFAGIDLWLPMEDFWPWPEVFRTGKASVIEDIRTVRPFPLRDRLLALGIVTVLLIPMSVVGRLEGAIGLRFTQKRGFRTEEIELAQALANQAMLAMQLTRLSAESRESAVIAERNRMARDIHDTLAQGFTGVIMQLEATKGAIAQNNLTEATDRVERAGDLARVGLGEARRSVLALRPRSLQDTTLCLALDDLLKRMTNGSGLQAEFHLEGDEPTMPADWEEGLLRIAQESLTNTIKHAKAKTFRATLTMAANEIQFRLVDDGDGFDLHAEHEGFGLLGMKERVDQIGGQFILRSLPGQGTEIQIVLNNPTKPKPHDGGEHA